MPTRGRGRQVPELTRRGNIKLNPRLRLHWGDCAIASLHRTLLLVRVPSGEAVAPIYSARRLRLTVERSREFHLIKQSGRETIDLIEMRRQLTALRSQHSDNRLIATLLNRFLVKIAFLTEPTNLAHEQYLRSEFERTLTKVEEINAQTKSG
ncbi:hypothetical protein I3J27_30100 [Bradyrhizobium xenonodulans]|uniref:Uncharacterized protein n=1 Tax=Bradyrhizobium xenonodulans TaxID=2736875 RepID=A0ABY7MIS4_9BRAD|nr:hypothetical protein [Bradyrhizobium xenonodulans]WBL77247.1 hypothetical protein I3J27_30100 [Bradyrhizobium xenonodulans]